MQVPVDGEQPPGLLDVGVARPPVVVHHLGDPLVGEVLEEEVDERDGRIRGNQAARRSRLPVA
ncbi:MAG: hypothetical protein GKR86_10460 [Ilumatobacter sp.]|nr:hypothetical protein [Ilumatobacter sp.]